MAEAPYFETGRLEGKLDVVIENQNRHHDDMQAVSKRLETLEQNKADRSDLETLYKRVSAVESFKSRVTGGVAMAATVVGAILAWIIKKVNGA